MTVDEKRRGSQRRSGKIGAVAWMPAAKRKRGVSVKGGQGLTVDRDRIVGRARLIPRRNDHRSCALILSERLVAWRASRLSVEEQLMKRLF